MNNYQLYRTNPRLSGQVKWNFILEDSGDELKISKFQLTPISNNALDIIPLPINEFSTTHTENLRKYYSHNSDKFFNDKEYLDTQFVNECSIKYNPNYTNLYPTTYNMGCKRMSYKKYGKQFEFFCPVWLENVKSSIKFTFNIDAKNKMSNESIRMISKSVNLDLSNMFETKYIHGKSTDTHKNVLRYLGNFLNNTGIYSGNDNIAYIEFNEHIDKTSIISKTILNISGINLKSTNNLLTIDSASVNVSSSFNGVSTLLDTDTAILDAFKEKAFICPQLFNFNLCFNLDDILIPNIYSKLDNKNIDINVSLDVYVDNVLLETKDFDNEYDYIRKSLVYNEKDKNITKYIKEKGENGFNVFYNDKLDDIYTSMCHWCLNDNNDYIVNTYPGFEGITIGYENDKIVEYPNYNQYGTTPTIYNTGEPINGDCSTNWINIKYVNTVNDFYKKYCIYTNDYKTDGVLLSENNTFVNGIRYSKLPDSLKNTYLLGLVVNNKDVLNNLESFGCVKLYYNRKTEQCLYYQKINDLILLISNDVKYFTVNSTVKAIDKYLSTLSNEDIESMSYIRDVNVLLTNNIYPLKHVTLFHNGKYRYFYNKLIYRKNSNISIASRDLFYTGEYLYECFRYDGKIKPRFVTNSSTLYCKQIIDSSLKTIYGWTHDEIPTIEYNNNTETIAVPVVNSNNEYSWFNNNRCSLLKSNIKCIKDSFNVENYVKPIYEYVYDENEYTEHYIDINAIVKDLTIETLTKTYNLDVNSSNYGAIIKYLLSIYTTTIVKWNFIDNNINDYSIELLIELR